MRGDEEGCVAANSLCAVFFFLLTAIAEFLVETRLIYSSRHQQPHFRPVVR